MPKPHGQLKRFRATVPTRGVTLVRAGRVARWFWPRLKGLLGTRELPPGDGLLITPCSSVHMFGMRYAIDVVYLDGQDRIVGIDHSLAPGRVGRFHRGARYVIELPAGTCQRVGVAVGDHVAVGPAEGGG